MCSHGGCISGLLDAVRTCLIVGLTATPKTAAPTCMAAQLSCQQPRVLLPGLQRCTCRPSCKQRWVSSAVMSGLAESWIATSSAVF